MRVSASIEMPTNKPTNLEELIEEVVNELFYWGKEKYHLNPTEDEIRQSLREVARATCDAVAKMTIKSAKGCPCCGEEGSDLHIASFKDHFGRARKDWLGGDKDAN